LRRDKDTEATSAEKMSAEQQEGPTECSCPPEPVKPTAEQAEQAKKEAQEAFDYFDLDKSGYIDATEVEKVLRKWVDQQFLRGITEEQIKENVVEFHKRLDANSDAKVTFDELYNAVLLKGEGFGLPRKLTPEEAEEGRKYAQQLFDSYDVDKSGHIDATDIDKMCRQWAEEEKVAITPEMEAKLTEGTAEFLKFFDLSADGQVTFDELFKVFLGASHCEI